ncbi:MAG TPA: PGPGW domain-containing protein [Candidatus Nanoarchaeia archaeon]|nr:PGPGW domain-containing protein [Candidatus Nanoarchaeia archaeon]
MIRIKNGFLRKTIGISLVVIGIISLIVPVAPGWLFILTGLILLKYPPLKKYLLKMKQRKVFNHDK